MPSPAAGRVRVSARPGAGLGAAAVVIAIAVCAAPAGAEAGAGRVSRFDPDSALVEALRRIEGAPLTLEQAFALAAENATDVREARAALEAAEGELLREKGAFDPEIFAALSASRSKTPSSSPFARPDVIDDQETETAAGARMRLPVGTEIEASIGTRKLDTNSEFTSIDPEYRAEGRVGIRQPLLKGLGPGTSSTKTAAGRDRDAARALYRDALLQLQARVEATYWELYAAERDYAVQELIVERAGALLEQAQLRAGAGLVGPNDVANARVFLAESRLAALDQNERLDAISDQLATLLGSWPEGSPRFRPADDPPTSFPVDDIEVLLPRAFQENAVLRAAARSREASEARERGAQWNALPALDLVGSIGGNGLSGTSREVVFGGDTLRVDVDGGHGDALGQALERDFPTWSVGLELSFPIPLREGRGERNRLRGEVEQARQREEGIRRTLEAEVRAAHREVVNGQRRLEVAREGLEASFEQVRIGIIEYDNGRTTAFELVRLAADLAAAQQRLSQALVRTANAAADLRYLTAEFAVGISNRESSE